MKFILQCVLSVAFFVSQISAMPHQEVEAYVQSIKEHIQETNEAILAIPFDQQTFENTLKPWIQLLGQIHRSFNALHAFIQSNPSKEASHPIEDLLEFFLNAVQDNPNLYQALANCSEKISHDPESNPFQRYLANCFTEGVFDEFVLFSDVSLQKNANRTDLHILNLESCPESSASNLAEAILLQEADVICIQEMSTDYAYDLYEALQNTYAHFLYMMPANPNLAFQEYHPINGLLIASKYPIEHVQFHPFNMDQKDNQGCLDFVITDKDTIIGRVYLVLSQKDLKMQTFIY